MHSEGGWPSEADTQRATLAPEPIDAKTSARRVVWSLASNATGLSLPARWARPTRVGRATSARNGRAPTITDRAPPPPVSGIVAPSNHVGQVLDDRSYGTRSGGYSR